MKEALVKNSLKVKTQDFSIAIAIIFSWWGFLSFTISTRLGGVAYIGISFCILLMIIYPGILRFSKEEVYLKRGIVSFLIFVLVSFCGYEFLHEKSDVNHFFVFDFSSEGFNLLKNFPLWICGFLMLLKREKNKLGEKIFLLTLGYDVIVTTVALFSVPSYAKNATAGIVTSAMMPYTQIGAMGYELAYSIAILIPALFFLAMCEKKWWLFVFSVGCCFYVFKASFFIALLAMILNILLAIIFSIPTEKITMKIFFLVSTFCVILAIFFMWPHLGKIFLELSTKVESIQLSERFYQLGRMLLVGDRSGGTLARFDLYGQSIKGIKENAILGMAVFDRTYAVSGHSTILDNWCLFGILGIVPIVYTIMYMAKYTIGVSTCHAQKGITLAAYISFVFISSVDPVTAGPQILLAIFWALPMLIKVSNSSDLKKE